MGAGLADRDFSGISIDDLHPSVFRRWHDKAVAEGPDGKYRPASLESHSVEIERNPPTTEIELDADLFTEIRASDGSIMPPVKVEKYTVKATDSLPRIAEDRMGSRDMWKVLFLHNFRAGILFSPDELHALREIEIPFFGGKM